MKKIYFLILQEGWMFQNQIWNISKLEFQVEYFILIILVASIKILKCLCDTNAIKVIYHSLYFLLRALAALVVTNREFLIEKNSDRKKTLNWIHNYRTIISCCLQVTIMRYLNEFLAFEVNDTYTGALLHRYYS